MVSQHLFDPSWPTHLVLLPQLYGRGGRHMTYGCGEVREKFF
jgi:hypothetical protein